MVAIAPILPAILVVVQPAGVRGKYKQHYTAADQAAAFADADLMTGKHSLNVGFAQYGIPRSKLSDMRRLYASGLSLNAAGRSPTLPPAAEVALVCWALYLARAGFPPTRGVMLDKASQLADKYNVKFSTDDGKPGRRWWRSFRTT